MKLNPICRCLLALALFAAGPVTARVDAQESRVPGLLTSEAVGFIHINVADLWKSTEFMPIRRVISNAGEAFVGDFDRRFAPGPSAVEALTYIHTGLDAVPFPTGDPTGISGLWVIRTREAVKAQDLFNTLSKQGRTKTYGKASYHF